MDRFLQAFARFVMINPAKTAVSYEDDDLTYDDLENIQTHLLTNCNLLLKVKA